MTKKFIEKYAMALGIFSLLAFIAILWWFISQPFSGEEKMMELLIEIGEVSLILGMSILYFFLAMFISFMAFETTSKYYFLRVGFILSGIHLVFQIIIFVWTSQSFLYIHAINLLIFMLLQLFLTFRKEKSISKEKNAKAILEAIKFLLEIESKQVDEMISINFDAANFLVEKNCFNCNDKSEPLLTIQGKQFLKELREKNYFSISWKGWTENLGQDLSKTEIKMLNRMGELLEIISQRPLLSFFVI